MKCVQHFLNLRPPNSKPGTNFLLALINTMKKQIPFVSKSFTYSWCCSIDDIFVIWQYRIDNLNEFLLNLNNYSFTWTISQKRKTFLDVDIYTENGFIKTKIHIKDTNNMQCLHYSSGHPANMKKCIP